MKVLSNAVFLGVVLFCLVSCANSGGVLLTDYKAGGNLVVEGQTISMKSSFAIWNVKNEILTIYVSPASFTSEDIRNFQTPIQTASDEPPLNTHTKPGMSTVSIGFEFLNQKPYSYQIVVNTRSTGASAISYKSKGSQKGGDLGEIDQIFKFSQLDLREGGSLKMSLSTSIDSETKLDLSIDTKVAVYRSPQ